MPEAALAIAPARPAPRWGVRTRAVAVGFAALAGARVVSVLGSFVVTALTARGLAAEEFGLWMLLTALPGFFANLDLGLGNSLRNKLTLWAVEPGRERQAKAYFASSVRLCLKAAVVGIAVLLTLSPWLPWHWLAGPTAPNHPNWIGACLFVAAALAFNVGFGLANFGFLAYQESHLYAAFDMLRSLGSAAAVATVVYFSGKLFGIVFAFFGAVLLSTVAAYVVFMVRRGWLFGPSNSIRARDFVSELGGSTLLFGILQVSSAVIVFTGAAAVSRVAGLAETGNFAVAQKLFLLLLTAQFFFLTPLWSAYTDAHATQDGRWIRRSVLYSALLTAAMFVGGGAVLTVIGPWIIRVWTGKVVADRALLVSLAAWALAYGWSSCFSVYLNGIGRLKRQAVIGMAAAAANFPLAVFLGHRWGLSGVCWAGVLVILPSVVNNTLETLAHLPPAERIA